MIERNARVFLEKFRTQSDQGMDWLNAHMRVRFSAEERQKVADKLKELQ